MKAVKDEEEEQHSDHHHQTVKETPEHSNAMGLARVRNVRFSDFTDFNDFLKISRKLFDENMSKEFVYKETLDDFDLFCTLGHGSFGETVLVRLKNSEKYSSMEVIDKQLLIKQDRQDFFKREKRILQSLHSPFAIHLESFFQDDCYVYFVIPYYPLKLFDVLSESGKLDEHTAKFYMSQVVLALEHLHYLDLIFRDLKPENILICENGYIKLTNFGCCKHLEDSSRRTYTFCGTPDYIAPEVILRKGYGFSVDWWGFGALTYELVAGTTPFRAKEGEEEIIVYGKIVDNKYTIPKHFSLELKDLIKHVLNPDLTRRFGNLQGGVNDIKYHKWFRTISWLSIMNRTTPPPYKPTKQTNEHTICDGNRSWKRDELLSVDSCEEVFKDI